MGRYTKDIKAPVSAMFGFGLTLVTVNGIGDSWLHSSFLSSGALLSLSYSNSLYITSRLGFIDGN